MVDTAELSLAGTALTAVAFLPFIVAAVTPPVTSNSRVRVHAPDALIAVFVHPSLLPPLGALHGAQKFEDGTIHGAKPTDLV